MKRAIPIAVFLIVFAQSVHALSPQAGQENIALTLFPAQTQSVYLIINSPAGETLTTQDWVAIEGGQSFRLPSGGVAIVNLTVSVPTDQAIGDYTFPILLNDLAISTLHVTVTLPPSHIQTLQQLADVSQKIDQLKSELSSTVDNKLSQGVQGVQSQVQSIKTDLSASIQEVKVYNKQVDDLENHRARLEEQVLNLSVQLSTLENNTHNLRQQNNQLQATGNYLRSESPILFLVGLAIGAAGMYLFSRKLQRYL